MNDCSGQCKQVLTVGRQMIHKDDGPLEFFMMLCKVVAFSV